MSGLIINLIVVVKFLMACCLHFRGQQCQCVGRYMAWSNSRDRIRHQAACSWDLWSSQNCFRISILDNESSGEHKMLICILEVLQNIVLRFFFACSKMHLCLIYTPVVKH